jgi:uncharacterized membrane protein YiaA
VPKAGISRAFVVGYGAANGAKRFAKPITSGICTHEFSASKANRCFRWRILGCSLRGGGFGIGLWNATLALSEKGFDAMAFLLGLFGAVAVQKNIRDLALFEPREAADRDTQSQQA